MLLVFIVIFLRLYGIFKMFFMLNIDMSCMKVIVNNLNEIFELEKIKLGVVVLDYI